jgi:hypothetical protein
MASAMVRGMVLLAAVVLASAADLLLGSAVAQHEHETVVWTVTIPEGFPGKLYTWRIKPDGTYDEDGRDALTGRPIQQTLSGRWTVEGGRMILRQSSIPFVFDGLVVGDRYSGTLYLRERRVSRFCAAKGETAPPRCEEEVQAGVEARLAPVALNLFDPWRD